MNLKCVKNQYVDIPSEITNNYSFRKGKQPLLVGKKYIVFSIKQFMGFIWYSICDEEFTSYPVYYPSVLFEISDSRISRYWCFSLEEDKAGRFVPFISFSEWVCEEYFWDRLTDWEEREERIFADYKEKMDMEFEDDSVELIAEELNSEWLLCPTCVDAWEESNTLDALVKCPVCQKVMNNPRYVKRLG